MDTRTNTKCEEHDRLNTSHRKLKVSYRSLSMVSQFIYLNSLMTGGNENVTYT